MQCTNQSPVTSHKCPSILASDFCLSLCSSPSLVLPLHMCVALLSVEVGARTHAMQTAQFCGNRSGPAKAGGFQVNITPGGKGASHSPIARALALTDYYHLTFHTSFFHPLTPSLSFTLFQLLSPSLSVAFYLFLSCSPSSFLFPLFSKGSTCAEGMIKGNPAQELRPLRHVKMCRSKCH